MENRVYYYARVSTKEQNLDRQIAAFVAMGAEEREIITDKESGKSLDRPGYQALKNVILRKGGHPGGQISRPPEPKQIRYTK